MNNRKIVHLTSVHTRYDTRIFVKESCSLSNHGYEVSIIVADGKGQAFLRIDAIGSWFVDYQTHSLEQAVQK